jgi:hypothetical protein
MTAGGELMELVADADRFGDDKTNVCFVYSQLVTGADVVVITFMRKLTWYRNQSKRSRSLHGFLH